MALDANALAQLVHTSGVDIAELIDVLNHTGTTAVTAASDTADHSVHDTTSVTTFGELVAESLAGMTTNTRRTYATHLRRACEGISRVCDCPCVICTTDPAGSCGCGPDCRKCSESAINVGPMADVPVNSDTMRTSQLRKVVDAAERIAVKTAIRNNRARVAHGLPAARVHGHSAQETAVRALSRAMETAIDDNLLKDNPMVRVKSKPRQKTHKRALRPEEFAVFLDHVAAGGNDPDLDLLLVWFHLESGARAEGGWGLTVGQLKPATQMIDLGEKFNQYGEQPVSGGLLAAIAHHATSRGGPRCDPASPHYDSTASAFWYAATATRPAAPLTAKRYESLFKRVQKAWPVAAEISLTAHGLRKAAGTAIERMTSTQVARVFLRHSARTDADLYTEASLEEVARAVAAWTGTGHPLAR